MVILNAKRLVAAALLVCCATATGCGDPATKGATQMTAEQMKQSAENPKAAPKK